MPHDRWATPVSHDPPRKETSDWVVAGGLTFLTLSLVAMGAIAWFGR